MMEPETDLTDIAIFLVPESATVAVIASETDQKFVMKEQTMVIMMVALGIAEATPELFAGIE